MVSNNTEEGGCTIEGVGCIIQPMEHTMDLEKTEAEHADHQILRGKLRR